MQFILQQGRNQYGKAIPVEIPGSDTIYIVQSIRPHRSLSMAYIHETRVALMKELGKDYQSIVVGCDYPLSDLLVPGKIVELLLSGEITQS